jgi:hypothetical protein
VLAVAAAAALVAALAGANGAGAGSGTRVIELGRTPGSSPNPACPANCEAIVRVTAFQRRTAGTGGERNPFISPVTGRIVAFSVTTSRPNSAQRHFFNENFGVPPMARIGVVNKVDSAPVPKYRLLRQSPREKLTDYLGEKTIFTLREPLYIKQGHIVVLTIASWAPALANGLSTSDTWRGSREVGKCPGTIPNAKDSRPHQQVDTTRRYACDYNTARVLYTAFVVTNQ